MKPKLNLVRKYLTECRLSDFEIGAEETKMIETDFVKMREEINLEVETLHSLLVVSRLIGLSKGLKTLDTASWETAKRLEVERNSRVSRKPNASEA
jgi:Mini-chromosome maintenance replisome factor